MRTLLSTCISPICLAECHWQTLRFHIAGRQTNPTHFAHARNEDPL